MSTRHCTLSEAQDAVTRALVNSNTAEANARSVARALVLAAADGLKGHGLSRVASYAAQSRCGKVDGHAVPQASQPSPAVVTVDAAHGFAYPALDLAIAELIPLAAQQGVALAAIRRSHHCGAMGLVVERLGEAGLVALMVANTPAAIAPWGGRRALFGTNPIAFAAPMQGRTPAVVDLSLSKVARGNILAARQRNELIPPGWAFDAAGAPTTDPDAALAGTMAPVGEAKGTALALIVELLAAGLTGSHYAYEASSYLDAEGPPPDTGQLIVAIAPDRLGGGGIVTHLGRLLAEIEAEPGARLPGSRRLVLRRRAEAEGLEVPDSLFDMAGVG